MAQPCRSGRPEVPSVRYGVWKSLASAHEPHELATSGERRARRPLGRDQRAGRAGCGRGTSEMVGHLRAAAATLLLLLTQALLALADGDAAVNGVNQKSRWGPDNPKPFILKNQKYIGPFMAMCAASLCGLAQPARPPTHPPPSPAARWSHGLRLTGWSLSWSRLTFVILGGMILFICMFERKEREQWPFGPWYSQEEKAAGKNVRFSIAVILILSRDINIH